MGGAISRAPYHHRQYRQSIREVALPPDPESLEATSFAACLATILELALEELPRPRPDEDPALGRTISRWLDGLGLGLVPIARPDTFSWPGPWIARVATPGTPQRRCVVMFGVPSGVVWDPAGDASPRGGPVESEWIADGFLVAAADVALARPPLAHAPATTGTVEAIFVAEAAGQPTRSLERVRALADRGLESDRHADGRGTFPSGVPGSALTLIEAEVCESFDPRWARTSTGEIW